MRNHMATIREARRRKAKVGGNIIVTRAQIDALLDANGSMDYTNDEVWNQVKACLESQDGLDDFLDFILN